LKVVIVGCGRVGAGLAERMAREGHEVTVVDVSSAAFGRLEPDFPGQALRGDGTDEDVLRRAGTDGADIFFALTEGDNRNVLAAQLANETFGVERVVAKVNDPVRAEAYTMLGLATICRTRMLIDALARHAGLAADPGAAGVQPATVRHEHGATGGAAGQPMASTTAKTGSEG
jgi:trk system potassium uptake protein TrkA